MYFIITIDVEEDNWGEFNPNSYSLKNIKRIARLQGLFDEFEVRPTYLLTYPVVINPMAVNMFSTFLEQGRCEIGMHCHPWNTPPFDQRRDFHEAHSMLCNLPGDLQEKKLIKLHETMAKNLGCAPVSFRAGRWALGLSAVQSLCKLGYRVETSVTPYVNWNFSYGPDFSKFGPEPFRFSPPGNSPVETKCSLLQVPASIGYLQKNFQVCQRLGMAFENRLGRSLRIKGIMDSLGLVNKVWLSPELADSNSMIALAKRMEKNKFPCVNMTFHSTSLLAGLSPFVKTPRDEVVFIEKIRTFLIEANKSGWKSLTLAQFENIYEKTLEPVGYARLDHQKRTLEQHQTVQMQALFQRKSSWL